tara:strand:+ start:1201 stop:1674 length:474 start_codon:yes stop_codon:yes gene_type:complete
MDEQPNFEILSKLSIIESILQSAPALNGEFESLVKDVQIIKESQDQIKESLASIKKSVYEPDTGVFSRVQRLEEKITRQEEFDQSVSIMSDRHKEISIWVDDKDKLISDLSNDLKISSQELDRLVQWKANVSKILWVISATVTTLIVKTLFTLLSSS